MPLNTIPNKGLTSRGYPSDRLLTPIMINGDMSVAQRGTSVSSISSGGAFDTVDRFSRYIASAGTWTISQSTDTPTGQGFANSVKFDCTSANSSLSAGSEFQFRTKLEGQNLQMLKKGTSSAESTTLSFWVKSNKTGTYICELFDHDNSRHINKSYTISSANTWEKKIIAFPGDTTGALGDDNGNSLQVSWWLANGTNWTSGTLQTSWGARDDTNRAVGQVNLADSTSNEWYITGVQLEVGEFDSTTLPSFPFESYGSNLQKCKRYFQYSVMGWYGATNNGGGFGGACTFAVEHRATPSYVSGFSSILDNNNRFTSSAISSANNLSQFGLMAQKPEISETDSGYYFAKMATDAEL